MSLCVNIFLVRGIKLWEQDLYVEGKPQCSHKIPKKAKFCPVCGKKVAKQSEERPEYLDGPENDGTLCGFTIIRGGTDTDAIYVGEIVAELGHYDAIPVIIPETKNDLLVRLRIALKPLGLWDINNFDLWLVKQISY